MNNDLGDIQSRKVENHEEIDDIFDKLKLEIKNDIVNVSPGCCGT